MRAVKECKITGCVKNVKARMMCSKHYTREIRGQVVEKELYISDTERECAKCGVIKPNDEFYSHTHIGRTCKPCGVQVRKKWKKDNPEAYSESCSKSNAKRKYGEDGLELWHRIRAGEPCQVCGRVDSNTKNMHIDHNHTTGKVRGILCNSCNMALGSMREDPEAIVKLLHYLIKYEPEKAGELEDFAGS